MPRARIVKIFLKIIPPDYAISIAVCCQLGYVARENSIKGQTIMDIPLTCLPHECVIKPNLNSVLLTGSNVKTSDFKPFHFRSSLAPVR